MRVSGPIRKIFLTCFLSYVCCCTEFIQKSHIRQQFSSTWTRSSISLVKCTAQRLAPVFSSPFIRSTRLRVQSVALLENFLRSEAQEKLFKGSDGRRRTLSCRVAPASASAASLFLSPAYTSCTTVHCTIQSGSCASAASPGRTPSSLPALPPTSPFPLDTNTWDGKEAGETDDGPWVSRTTSSEEGKKAGEGTRRREGEDEEAAFPLGLPFCFFPLLHICNKIGESSSSLGRRGSLQ